MSRGFRWLAPGPGSGFGDAAEAYLSGLRAAGMAVTWTPLGWPSPLWDAPYGPVMREPEGAVNADIADVEIEHDTLVVCSTPLWNPQLADDRRGRLLAAYTTWETDRLPTDFTAVLNRYDRVLVPSQFNAEVFTSSGLMPPVDVVPHIARVPQIEVEPRLDAVPPAEPGPSTGIPPAEPGPRAGGTFVFYVIASWSTRKAIRDLVAAYLTAFTAADDVLLSIHTTPEDIIAAKRDPAGMSATRLALAELLAGQRDAPRIKLSTRVLPRAEIERLHAAGDCFVLLSRGEGWGLGAFDAAVFGNPVIVTGWGGTLEFLPDGYPYLVEYDLVPTVAEQPDYWWHPRPGEQWAKARIDHAAMLMRRVFEHREEAVRWGLALREAVTRRYGEREITQRLIAALS